MSPARSLPPHIGGVDIAAREFERWASLAAATAAIAYGVSRRSRAGLAVAAAAAPLAYHAVVGEWPRIRNGRAAAETSADRAVRVREAIRLEVPLDEVYRFWRQLDNLPRFMSYLARVWEIDNRRSHWVAKGPAGFKVEWDAEIIREVPNRVIAWRSLPGSSIATAGSVTFSTARGGRSTQLSVDLEYAPPAGRAGAMLASLFGREPSQTIREDLRHVKQLLEAGEIPQSAASPRRRSRR